MKSLVVAAALLGLGSEPDDHDLVAMADRYCIQPDGDHRLTWALAERDGFQPVLPEDAPDLRLPGGAARNLRGFHKTVGTTEFRVLTSNHRLIAPDDGIGYFRRCWVFSSQESIADVNERLRRRLAIRPFRAERTYVYAWIPRPGDQTEIVPRRIYMRSGMTLAREQGMREVTSRRLGDGVSIGYASPRDEATFRDFDWAGPEPVPIPARRH